jgi:predicted transcriptional regulator
MTYKTGSIGDFMRWTKQVVTDPVAAKDTPKRWFDNEETAAKSSGTSASPEAMVKLLSAENLVLLHIIGTERPGSLRALAALAHRKESNLSRTLKKTRSGHCRFRGWGRAHARATAYCTPRHARS